MIRFKLAGMPEQLQKNNFINDHLQPRQFAAAISTTIPIVVVLIIYQKQLVKGLAAGAVKG